MAELVTEVFTCKSFSSPSPFSFRLKLPGRSEMVSLGLRIPLSHCQKLLRLQLHRSKKYFNFYLHKKFSTVNGEKILIPRRCILYVPGDDAKKIGKIASTGPDCAVLDCEDGVAHNRKEQARELIRQKLEFENFGRSECSVRINSIDSGLAEKDLQVILKSKRLPSTIFLPKVDEVHHIDWIAEKLATLLKSREDGTKLQLFIYTESARGLLQLQNICERAIQLSKESQFILSGIVFGSDDFCANIGATRTTEANEIFYARQHIVVVAKAYELQAVDFVFINYKDLDGLHKESVEGAKFGFTGKQVIHPMQVSVVHKAFSPSKEKIDWATQLIQEFEEQQKLGKGAFTFHGQMIDRPLLLQAKNIVQLASLLDK